VFQLKGIISPVATPFDESGAVRYGDYERNLDKYVEAGIETFVLLGSTAESVYLEHDEKVKLLEIARKRVPSSVKLLAGTGLESTKATIELTKEAIDCGMDGVLVKNPSYYKPAMNSEVYLAHYSAVADASTVPVILYNIPVFTGVPLETALVTTLAAHPSISGLKDSSGNVQFLSEVVWAVNSLSFSVVAGVGSVLLPNMLAGAKEGRSPGPCRCRTQGVVELVSRIYSW
jgi:4-hydroxy-2-oxoglutarate aldolase